MTANYQHKGTVFAPSRLVLSSPCFPVWKVWKTLSESIAVQRKNFLCRKILTLRNCYILKGILDLQLQNFTGNFKVERVYIESQLYRLKALDEERFVEAGKLRNLGLALQELMQIMHEITYNPNQPRVPAGSPEGGRWTTDYEAIARRFWWTSPEALKKHVAKHGENFNTRSARDYARKAQEFRERAIRNKFPMHVNKSGNMRAYDPKTNTFGAYRKDGSPRTFFKPPDGIEYYKQQEKRFVGKSGRVINPIPRSGGGGSGAIFDRINLPGGRFRPPNR